MVIKVPAMETDKISNIKIAKPQANLPTSTDVVKTEAAARGHNVFRPDIYRVSEGYVV